jgi:hypothetical protein
MREEADMLDDFLDEEGREACVLVNSDGEEIPNQPTMH